MLSNCPFQALAGEHADVVCGMNLAFVRALVDEAGVTGVDPVPDPAPGRCCVVLERPPAA